MTTRLLPPSDWPRLAGTDLRDVWQLLPVTLADVVVVEDDGEIVAHCVVMPWVHGEGLGVQPEYRGDPGVWRRLLKGIGEAVTARGASALIAGSASDEMTDYLTRAGAKPLPASFYVVPMGRYFMRKEQPCPRS